MSRTAAQQLRAEPHQVSRAASSGALRMRRPTSAELPPGGAEHSSAAPESAGSAAPLARYLRAWRQAGSPALSPALAVRGYRLSFSLDATCGYQGSSGSGLPQRHPRPKAPGSSMVLRDRLGACGWSERARTWDVAWTCGQHTQANCSCIE